MPQQTLQKPGKSRGLDIKFVILTFGILCTVVDHSTVRNAIDVVVVHLAFTVPSLVSAAARMQMVCAAMVSAAIRRNQTVVQMKEILKIQYAVQMAWNVVSVLLEQQ